MKMKKRIKKILLMTAILAVFLMTATTAFADGDPLQVVNNLSDFSAPVINR